MRYRGGFLGRQKLNIPKWSHLFKALSSLICSQMLKIERSATQVSKIVFDMHVIAIVYMDINCPDNLFIGMVAIGVDKFEPVQPVSGNT